MQYEKSCGGVIYRQQGEGLEYLLILNKKPGAKGHWGFPKGHIEPGETEEETALREIREETGLSVQLVPGFRTVSHYMPRPGVEKDAVYFLAKMPDGEISLQASEVADYCWCDAKTAGQTLRHDQAVLSAAAAFLAEKETK